jgi:hypothetical protein
VDKQGQTVHKALQHNPPSLSILKKAKKNLLTTDLPLQSTVIHTFSTTGGKVLNSDI